MEGRDLHRFTTLHRFSGSVWIFRFALLMLCAAYLQGSLTKLLDFDGATAEMEAFGLRPAGPVAAALIAFELACSAMVIGGFARWLGAGLLAGFTLLATGLALKFWTFPTPARSAAENAFFEHIGLAGAFLIVAWYDLRRTEATTSHLDERLSRS
ncbi:DoxX family protein [Methylobacterium sp. M6A4_1b]